MSKIRYANYIIKSDNIGDNAQVYALERIYSRMGIPSEEVVHLQRDIIQDQVEERCHYILPLVSSDLFYLDLIQCLMDLHMDHQFSFIPLTIGQTRYNCYNENGLQKFRHIIDKFEMPIGCRDYDSASMYANLGYNSYTNGCITNTLPRRMEGKTYDKIYFIDIPAGIKPYIPQEISERAVFLTQAIDFDIPADQQARMCRERYELLRDTAALVVTCRYHVAHPCCAMGIPVIMLENNNEKHHWSFDPRFPAMNPHIPFYTKEEWSDIDWNPAPADFEDVKEDMISLAVSRIENAALRVKTIDRQSAFFAPSKERFWNVFLQNRHKIDIFGFTYYLDGLYLSRIGKDFRYYLYGLSKRYQDEGRCILLEYMQRRYLKAEFLGFVDKNKSGGGISWGKNPCAA